MAKNSGNYTIHTDLQSQTGNVDVGPIQLTLNSADPADPNSTNTGTSKRYHSKVGGDDLTETIDVIGGPGSSYAGEFNAGGVNTL